MLREKMKASIVTIHSGNGLLLGCCHFREPNAQNLINQVLFLRAGLGRYKKASIWDGAHVFEAGATWDNSKGAAQGSAWAGERFSISST